MGKDQKTEKECKMDSSYFHGICLIDLYCISTFVFLGKDEQKRGFFFFLQMYLAKQNRDKTISQNDTRILFSGGVTVYLHYCEIFLYPNELLSFNFELL